MKAIRVVAAIIQDGDRIFATQRGYGAYKDGWEFPGGKIELGETPEDALRREIMEELNTRIAVGKKVITIEYDYPQFHLSTSHHFPLSGCEQQSACVCVSGGGGRITAGINGSVTGGGDIPMERWDTQENTACRHGHPGCAGIFVLLLFSLKCRNSFAAQGDAGAPVLLCAHE